MLVHAPSWTRNRLMHHCHSILNHSVIYCPPSYAQSFHSPSTSDLILPSALSGSHLTATVNVSARIHKITHTRYPSKICNFVPVAKMLENNAGAKDRMPDTIVSARPFRVPSVACVGEISFSANWTPASKPTKSVPKQKCGLSMRMLEEGAH